MYIASCHGVAILGNNNNAVTGAVRASLTSLTTTIHETADLLGTRAAEAASAFALASNEAYLALSKGFLSDIEDALDKAFGGLELSDAEKDGLAAVLTVERAYLAGFLEGGALALTLRDAFPDGDWDEEDLVRPVVRKRFGFLESRLDKAMLAWAEKVDAERSKPKPKPAAKPQKLEPLPARQAPSASERKVRLSLLLSFAGELGVRIRKVPDNPSLKWLDKLQSKLEEIAVKKGVPSPFAFGDDQKGTEETMAFVLPSDPKAEAERNARIAKMMKKAQKAGLKLGTIPEQPSADWLGDIEAKLEEAMAARRKERKAKREKLARQRKERMDNLQSRAAEHGVDLGRIPPFPTEEWIARAEHKVAEAMLPTQDKSAATDSGRAERLATLLARAAEVGLELEVPPDPGAVWLGWAESQIDHAAGSGEALAVESDPDDVTRVPTLLFEEGTVQEQRWPILEQRFTIGRARNNQAQIRHDGQLSRQHCAIESHEDGFTIQDLRSTQGTRLNGEPVREPTPLKPGDVISIGETNLVFRYC